MKKYVVITGISSGIGLDACRYLISLGYFVIGTVRKQEDKERLLESFPVNLACFICDLSHPQTIEDCTQEIKSFVADTPIHALINNAGIAVPGPMHLVSDEDFEQQMNVNLLATRKFTNQIIPLLDVVDGSSPKIIFISSVSGIFAAPFNGPYCVSKHALECLIDIYRRELKYLNIDVIAIQPGPIQTKIWSKVQGRFDKFKVGVFAPIAEKADHIIQMTEKNALPVIKVSECIGKILNSKKPKNRYMIHKNQWAFKFVAYCLPSAIVDKLIWKNLNKPSTDKYRPV